jgi:hypothetical protein
MSNLKERIEKALKNIKKRKILTYTPFLCVFLTVSVFATALCEGGCASAITQIPKDERMNSGLNIYATIVDNGSPYEPPSNLIDTVKVKLTNDGNSKVKTDVVCERNGAKKATTVIMEPYTIREVYLGFHRDDFHDEITCKIENTEFLEWCPLM